MTYINSYKGQNWLIPQVKNIKESIRLKKSTKVGVDCGYSDGINIKFTEDEKMDLEF